jgi:uroporphyrinogen decarboxylase
MKSLLEILKSKSETPVPPTWMMRQAGRYLPEYRTLRTKAGSFLDLAYNPDLASEVTLQPIDRYEMDGAILFSDILIIPHALGQGLEFKEGEGPVLNTKDLTDLSLKNCNGMLSKIYKTVEKVKADLDDNYPQTSFIGFSGGAWTVACYMIQGHGKTNFPKIFDLIESNPKELDRVMGLVIQSTIEYLNGQASAGVDVLKIFDSWAGLLKTKDQFDRYIIQPTKQIIDGVRETHPNMPFIGFPRHVPIEWLADYIKKTNIDGLAVGEDIKLSDVKTDIVLQGNLDNQLLLAGGDDLKQGTQNILDEMVGRPFIFNLGHGIIKETPPEHVQMVLDVIRK